jgi:hypothetical protein
MPYTYVRFSSKNLDTTTGKSIYTVDIPSGIQNARSVHVKSFSMPNTAYNVTSDNLLFKWYEYDDSTSTIVEKEATFTQAKYYTVGELLSDMTALMNATVGTLFTFTISQIPSTTVTNTFLINVNVVSTDINDLWCPVVSTGSVWEQLGFLQNFQFDPVVLHRGRSTIPVVNPISDGSDSRWLATDVSPGVDHVAQFPPRDSHESFHITSSLANNVYEAEGDGHTRHTNYLLTIPNTANRYEWLQYVPTEPVFHDLRGDNVNQFTIGIADEHGDLLDRNEHQTFSVVLAFEYDDQHVTLTENQRRSLHWRSRHC